MRDEKTKRQKKLEEVSSGAFVATESLDTILQRKPRTFRVSQEPGHRVRVIFFG
jgi:hypothetical protein